MSKRENEEEMGNGKRSKKGLKRMVGVMLDNELGGLLKVVDSLRVFHSSSDKVVLEVFSVNFELGSNLLEKVLHAVGLLPQSQCCFI